MGINLTLKQKIFLGYISMISLTIIVAGYAIWSLQELNKITNTIIFNDAVATEKIAKLNDSILGQDLFEKRFLGLREADAETAFWSRNREFKSLLSEIGESGPQSENIASTTRKNHNAYTALFSREVEFLKAGDISEAEKISSGEMKAFFQKILINLKELERKIKERQNNNISKSNLLGERALMITIILSIVSLVFGILFASLITNYLNTSFDKLREAADSIRSGNFDNLPEIHGADELADLAISFKEMSVRLKELEAMNLDANPLTKLPGNLAIEKELLTRLNETRSFSFCLADLDNFKAYSDRYGYSKGSDVLQWLGELLLKTKKEYGTPDDFLGHIGGDDFVLICSTESVTTICNKIIEEFDKGIKDHYDPEDAQKGFIVSVDRNDKPAIFNIMTLSIAVVNTDRTLIREPREVAQKVAELKQYAKKFPKSIYVMDRRKSS